MERHFVQANSSNLPKVDALMIVLFFKDNVDLYAAELKNVKTAPSLAGSSVRVNLRILRRCGFYRARGASRRATLHAAHRALTLALTTLYLAQEFVYAYQERADMDKLARVMFLLLCHVTSLVKQLVFYVDADRINRMIDSLDAPLYNSLRSRRLLEATARRAGLLARVYPGAAVVTCTLWAVFPVLHHAHSRAVHFPFWVGLDYSQDYKFWIVLLYSYYVTTLVGIANTTMDAFIATILNQSKTQLRILRLSLEELPERARAAARSGESLERALHRLFRDCLTHYSLICQGVKTLQDIFGWAILVQFGIGGWILCMAAYQIVSLSVLSIEFASMTLFICCILTELFLYCFYGNEVAVESSRVVESVYCMRWEECTPQFRRALLVLMERAHRPLAPAAGLVVPLSLNTFLKIIKSSYTFYAVLRQTK